MRIPEEAVQAAIEEYSKTRIIRVEDADLVRDILTAAMPYLQFGYDEGVSRISYQEAILDSADVADRMGHTKIKETILDLYHERVKRP